MIILNPQNSDQQPHFEYSRILTLESKYTCKAEIIYQLVCESISKDSHSCNKGSEFKNPQFQQ
jgi:hypothetical protein